MKQRPHFSQTLKRPFTWVQQYKKIILLSVVGGFLTWLLFAVTIGVLYERRHANDPLTVGVSFSKEYSQEL